MIDSPSSRPKAEVAAITDPPLPTGPRKPGSIRRQVTIRLWQLLIVVIILAGWQFTPKIPHISNTLSFENTFFISSPSLVVKELWQLATGENGAPEIWSPIAGTVVASLIGTIAALIVGALAGITVSNWSMLATIFRPFLTVVNAVPKVAIIPIVVLLVHSSDNAAVITAFVAVFFVAFYNAEEGASSVPIEMIQNAELLGASKLRVMMRVRSPYAVGWTLATLPNAIAFGLTATVTAEIITGGSGLGYQLLLALDNSNATLLFSIVIVVAVIGVVLVLGAGRLRRLLLPWWESSSQAG